jgi:hypothetical protein
VPVVNVLLYFFLALVLLSQTQFALLRTRWLWSKTPVARHLARNWLIYGLSFFAILAVLSFVLPTTYSLGFFETFAYLLNILGLVFRFLVSLALLPLTLCARLFGSPDAPPIEQPPAAEPPPPPPATADGTSLLWQFIQSLLFWGALVAVVVFALSHYFRANAYFFRRLARLPFLAWLVGIARGIWSWLVGANRTVARMITTGLQRLRPPSVASIRQSLLRARRGALNPREQVMEIYLTLIDLGHKIGPGRRQAETPYQYSRDYIGAHPQVTTEVLDLTDAFNEARYSEHPIPPESIPTLREEWKRIRDQAEKEQLPPDPTENAPPNSVID